MEEFKLRKPIKATIDGKLIDIDALKLRDPSGTDLVALNMPFSQSLSKDGSTKFDVDYGKIVQWGHRLSGVRPGELEAMHAADLRKLGDVITSALALFDADTPEDVTKNSDGSSQV